MKKFILLIAITVLSFQTLYAQTAEPGKIVVFRKGTFSGLHAAHNIFLDDSLVVMLTNNTFYNFECKPGVHSIRVNEFVYTTIQVDIKPGETHYIQLTLQRQSGVDIPSLTEVDENVAMPSLQGTVKRNTNHGAMMIDAKRRIGIGLQLGTGFTDVEFGQNNTGMPITLSFGGGYALNVKYGRVYHNRYDLAFDLSYQVSVLTPAVSNANITFRRAIFSITPSYIIPLKDGYRSFIKIGVGAAYYFNSSLKIETSKVQGIDDKWTYKDAYGAHLTAIYEMHLSKKVSVNFGLKGYYVTYAFSSGQQSKPAITKLSKPDGSGIDIIAGINYHF